MRTMRRGWLHLATGAGVGRFFGFISNLFLSRWLGPSDLGFFTLITTTVQATETLVRCGGDYALNFELGGQPQAMETKYGLQLCQALSQICTLTTSFICFGIGVWIWFGHDIFMRSFFARNPFGLTILLLLMIACEGISSSAWETLLATQRTSSLALRQGLFFPLRLLLAAIGALCSGVPGAMVGWVSIAVLQCFWLKKALGQLWVPLQIWPPLTSNLRKLLKRGFPFYAVNLLSSIIFYPLLLKVASASGISDIGYLRVGQILQQLFAFLPATLVPVLFFKVAKSNKL